MTITNPNPKEPTVAENDAPQPKPTVEERYPEHAKQTLVVNDARIIGQFIEWLRDEKDSDIAQWDDEAEEYIDPRRSIEEWLALYFDIDLKKISAEKIQMILDITGG